ncbi:SAM-dependent methyltransferase [Rhodospirillum centenum]|uniref:Tellurite resistance protein TehB, putative n=1 Tax=Rhodospirillum centenum (strain ATCC 51521 / SW) TaxID=414684 RepID=B6IW35_RHOCS|nr:class I SAM-dependent methyltransferase [Rhodospirillum centenum]ACJ00509.1 tellurite resistance protein TehB, putative [Rhodospirillum centenum SW]
MSSFWDERFATDGFVYGTEPNAFLTAQASLLAPGGRVLLPGDGEGRNGVWLAERGLEVLAVDSSAVGLAKAERLARERGVRIATAVADLAAWDWPEARFDAVVVIFLHLPPDCRARVHAAMARSLRPGGVLILETFRPAQLGRASGGPKDPALLYDADMLRRDFAGLEILLLEEADPALDEGPFHRGPAATVRLVARRPQGRDA